MFFIKLYLIMVLIMFQANRAYSREHLKRCFYEASKRYGVNPLILFSIAKNESNFKANAKNINKNGSKDIGMMQINSTWLPILKKYNIDEGTLQDPCLNIHVGSWIMAQAIQDFGNTWRAVGAYNAGSSTKMNREILRKKYAQKIYRHYVAYKLQLGSK